MLPGARAAAAGPPVRATIGYSPRMHDALLADHRNAVRSLVEAARSTGADGWNRPVAEGKWSPGEIAEHLRLTYAILNREIATGDGLRVRTSWLQRLLLRVVFLPRILGKGEIPAGARAAKEIRPAGGPFEREATLAGLEDEARRFEEGIVSRPGVTVTHHVFGRASAEVALRFCAVHTRHHGEQMRQASATPGAANRRL